jgi:hypothetical protein
LRLGAGSHPVNLNFTSAYGKCQGSLNLISRYYCKLLNTLLLGLQSTTKEGVRSATPQQQSIEELGVTLDFTLKAVTRNLTDEDVEELRELFEKDAKSFLHHYLYRKYERNKILQEQNLD